MSVIEIKNDRLSVGINTLGSELMYIRGQNGREYLWNGDESVWSSRAPVLFPICGGLKNNTYFYNGNEYHLEKHGFAKVSEFRGTRLSENSAEFVLSSDEETLKVYPFPFCLKIVFMLVENKLKVTNTVENTSEQPMYFSIGAHEGYSCPEGIEAYEVRFDEEQTLDHSILNGNLVENKTVRIAEGIRALPLKEEYFATDALVFRNISFRKAVLARRNGEKVVSLEFDRASNFLLWTKPNAKYICFEPWCGIPDLVGSSYDLTEKAGIIRLDGGKKFTFTHTIECFL